MSVNIDKAVRLIRELRLENDRIRKKNIFLEEQIKAIDSESKISARAMKDFEKMRLERIKVKDKIGVILNSLQDVK